MTGTSLRVPFPCKPPTESQWGHAWAGCCEQAQSLGGTEAEASLHHGDLLLLGCDLW